MVPRLSKGTSFKGAALYYLHDKRAAGEAERLTSARVAWTETRNLLTSDPERAWRLMAWTAMHAHELKAAAGIKATGRKLKDSVLAYSLAWHPDEKPDRAEMTRAAEASLRVLGLQEHEAIILRHTDTAHPHVHVIVNRVHPETGKAASSSNDFLKLSQWAEAYEREQGTIRCQDRVQNNARRMRGEFVKAARELTRADWEALRKRAANDNSRAAQIRQEQARKDAAIAAATRAMHARHRQEWAALIENARRVRVARFEERARAVRQAIDTAKAERKGDWRDLYRRHRHEARGFTQGEATVLGRIRNALGLVTRTPVGQQDESYRGHLARMFVYTLSGKARRNALENVQEGERAALTGSVRQGIGKAVQAVKEDAARKRGEDRATFLQDRAALIERQAQEKRDSRDAWRERSAERRRVWQDFSQEEQRAHEAEHAREQARAAQSASQLAHGWQHKDEPREQGRGEPTPEQRAEEIRRRLEEAPRHDHSHAHRPRRSR